MIVATDLQLDKKYKSIQMQIAECNSSLQTKKTWQVLD